MSEHRKSLWRCSEGISPACAALLVVGWMVACCPVAVADGPAIRFRVIDGVLCSRCVVRCADRSIPANVMIDLGLPIPLLVHERTAGLLGLTGNSRVELRFGDVVLTDVVGVGAQLPALERLTRDFASELGELPAVAIAGLPAFKALTLTPQLDISAGMLRLLPEAPPGQAAGPEQADENVCTVPYEEQRNGYWLSAAAPDGFTLRARFATSQYDTIVDATVADLAGAPGGDLDELHIGPLNIARFVALRPADLSDMSQLRPDIITGTNLLSHFRVTIDTVNRRMTFEQTREPDFPSEERRYFIAMVENDAAAIEEFLDRHPSSRLAGEAADKLLSLRLDEYPPDSEAIRRAVRHRAGSVPARRRAGLMVELADHLLAGDRDEKYELATYVLTVGLEYAPLDLNAKAAHQLHARLGHVALRRDDLKQARRHLLSAAFGMPKDPQVNHWMGEYYERSGKLARAWSRYVQAILTDEPPAGALRGLDRLNRNPAFRASFTMTDAEQLLEGRVPEFHAAERFVGDGAGGGGGHVELVELFSCIDHAVTLAPELAFGALMELFSGENVAFVEYHLPAPQTDPLVSGAGLARASFYGVEEAPVAFFDGTTSAEDGGIDRDADKVYQAYKTLSLSRSPGTGQWRVGGQVRVSNGEILGEVELTGPEATADLRFFVLLCEKAVMAAGANGAILHRQVARRAISPAGGFAVPMSPGRRTFAIAVDPKKVGAELESTIKRMEDEKGIEFLMRPTYVDGAQCAVVAFLQDVRAKTVMAAGMMDVEAGEVTP
ncbi:MAG: hypothetical protein JSV19_02815 [Phycisphaerales bacterium]|nr:MAG: hypothetical protein JSV19_02815 [Phycisphaerales bacterium]